jgi:ubiquinone biosynthesis protein UbiJ
MKEEGKRKALTFHEKLKISNWLIANRTKLHEERPGWVNLAKELGQILEVDLDSHRLRDLAVSIDMAWEPKEWSTKGGSHKWRHQQAAIESLTQRVDAMASRIESMSIEVDGIRASVERLAGRLDKLLVELGTERIAVVNGRSGK